MRSKYRVPKVPRLARLLVPLFAVLWSCGSSSLEGPGEDDLAILFIGNSLTFWNDMPDILEQLLEDADIELAARGIVGGIFPPAGQSCIAGSRVLVHHSLHDRLVDRLVALTKPALIGDPANPDTHIGPIANRPHFDRVLAAIEKGKADGATCVLGGEAVSPEGCAGWFVAPTIFTDVTPDMALAREEIFGPVLAVLTVQDDAQAIQLANDSDFGLAAGIWTQDSLRAMKLAERIGAGTVYINTYFGSAPQSPVGGFKQSGYGRENGIEGLLAFTQTKSVWLATSQKQPEPFT